MVEVDEEPDDARPMMFRTSHQEEHEIGEEEEVPSMHLDTQPVQGPPSDSQGSAPRGRAPSSPHGLFRLGSPKNVDNVYASTNPYPEKAFSFGSTQLKQDLTTKNLRYTDRENENTENQETIMA